MTRRVSSIIAVLALTSACGSRRVAGYLEDLEDCSSTASSTTGTGTEDGTSSSSTGSSGESAESTIGSAESTGTSSDTTEGTMETSGTTEVSTGEPMATCGNGVLEAFGPVPEECDDGNLDPDDGCNDKCAMDRQVFVTGATYKAGELQSLKLADALCGNLADDQGFPDALKYRAWLSDSTTDARDRFKQGRGRLVMVNGLVLAASWSALLSGELENPFEVTETSQTYHGPVWTGTRPDGTAVPDTGHCGDWSSDSFQESAYYGYSDRTTPEWTLAQADDNPILCISPNAIYCLQTL